MQLFIRRDGRRIELTVRPSDDIWEVKKLIERKENIPRGEQELTYNNTILSNDQTLSDYNVQDQSTLYVRHNPNLTYYNKLISVQNVFGKTSVVYVSSTDTIEQVRAKLQTKNEIVVENRPLKFAGRNLKEGQTLSYYSIPAESTLQLTPAVRGDGMTVGTDFADVSNERGLKKAQWSSSAPRWRHTQHGLCVEGECRNKDCEANGQMVIMPIGYKEFDIVQDADETTTQCPICLDYVEPKTCSFNNCWWRWSGKKQLSTGAAPVLCSGDWKYADNAYHYFDQQGSGTVRWKRLVFEATKNDPR